MVISSNGNFNHWSIVWWFFEAEIKEIFISIIFAWSSTFISHWLVNLFLNRCNTGLIVCVIVFLLLFSIFYCQNNILQIKSATIHTLAAPGLSLLSLNSMYRSEDGEKNTYHLNNLGVQTDGKIQINLNT